MILINDYRQQVNYRSANLLNLNTRLHSNYYAYEFLNYITNSKHKI